VSEGVLVGEAIDGGLTDRGPSVGRTVSGTDAAYTIGLVVVVNTWLLTREVDGGSTSRI
jgi:hypothetical protein